jgi:pyruvate formate lyase activating enzyme
MQSVPRTPAETLTRARRIARDAGLHFVYTGNVHDRAGGTTLCPGCGATLIERDWYQVLHCELDERGTCAHCGTAIAGHFGRFTSGFGRRRVPLHIAAT